MENKIALCFEWNIEMGKFNLHAILINWFHENMTLVLIHREASSHNLVVFYFVD